MKVEPNPDATISGERATITRDTGTGVTGGAGCQYRIKFDLWLRVEGLGSRELNAAFPPPKFALKVGVQKRVFFGWIFAGAYAYQPGRSILIGALRPRRSGDTRRCVAR
jgi:hypothetical protein